MDAQHLRNAVLASCAEEGGEAEDTDAEGVAAGSDEEATTGLEAETASDDEEAGSDDIAEAHLDKEADEASSSSVEAEEDASDGNALAEDAVDGSEQDQEPGNKPKRKQEATAGSLSSLKRELAQARAAKRAKSEDAEAADAPLEAEQPEPGERNLDNLLDSLASTRMITLTMIYTVAT